jgi:hypothetical protein
MFINSSISTNVASRIDAQSIKASSASPSSEVQNQPSDTPHRATSPGERLLQALWRSRDRIHLLGILDRHTGRFSNIPVYNAVDATEQSKNLSSDGVEVYFACAEFQNPDNRTAANTIAALGFWLDIDCGEDKAAAGKGYPTLEAAEDAVYQFCKDAGLPEPTHIVHSGSGLHVYWIVDSTIPRNTWQAHAKKLKALNKACGFLADDSRTTDIASVLRIPGTFNHKYTPSRPVTLHYASEEHIEHKVMLDAIADAHARLCDTSAAKPSGHRSLATCMATTAGNAHAGIYGPPDLERLSSALVMLDPDCDEETWKLRRLAPLAEAARTNPEMEVELYGLARSWSSGELRGNASMKWISPGGNGLTGEQVFDSVWLRFLTSNYPGVPTTLGTIYYDAIHAGWDPDDQFKAFTAAAAEDE